MREYSSKRFRALCSFIVAAFFAAGLLCISSIDCHAQDTLTFCLDAGADHEELAECMADDPESWLDSSFLQKEDDEVTNVSRDGSRILIRMPEGSGGVSFRRFYDSLRKGMNLYANEGDMYGDYFFDNGEMAFCRSSIYDPMLEDQVTVGFRPMEDYGSVSDFRQDVQDLSTDIEEGRPLYILWRKPIDSLEVEIEVPDCGETVTIGGSENYPLPDNRPVVTCPEPAVLYKYDDRSGNVVDHTYWANSFSMDYGRIEDPFEGTLKGGNEYLAAAYLGAKWGYFFAEDAEMTVNGEDAEAESHRSGSWPSEYILYKYIEPEHSFDDEWVVEKEPTCTDEGLSVCRCTACGAAETESIEIDPDAHDWGAWRVTKKPTATAAGEKMRVCRHDPAHIEKAPVDRLVLSGTLIDGMTSKGSNSLSISWTRVKNADGYDVFFAQCNHSGKNKKCRLVKTLKGDGKLRWVKKGLKKNTAYKAFIKAYVMKNGKKSYVRTGPVVHAFTTGGDKKFTNPKGVSVKKSAVTLKKGKTYRIKGKVTRLKKTKKLISTDHAPVLRYLSTDKRVATVSRSGKVRAKGRGSCTVYAYAANGARKAIRITVR